MGDNSNVGALRVVLVIAGIIFIFGIYPLSVVWPAGWSGTPAAARCTWR